jgi:hypothetical protein
MSTRRNPQKIFGVVTHGGSKKENECPMRFMVIVLLIGFTVCGSIMCGILAVLILPSWCAIPGVILGAVGGLSIYPLLYVAGRPCFYER